jgi:hypothetical protein
VSTRTSNRLRPVKYSRPVSETLAVHRGTRTDIVETPRILTEAGLKPGRLLVQLIKAGWSLNGRYYPAEVLRRDGPRAFPAGTLNYVDHATDEEDETRPAGSLRNLASYQTEDARWDEARQALVAEVRLYAPWREAVTDWAQSGAVGMSIRAWVYGENGTRDGREGWIVTEFDSGRSVDYVTVPAAGGAMLAVLESARAGRPPGALTAAAEARSVGVWLESRLHLALTQLGDDMYGNGRLTREERITLSAAIGDGLQAWTARVEADAPQLFERDIWDEPKPPAAGTAESTAAGEATSEEIRRALNAAVRAAHGGGDQVYVWLRDYDAEAYLVWWDRSTTDDCQTWQQTYQVGDGGAITLVGDPIEVVARVVYDPVPDPPGAAAVQQQAEAVVVVEAAPPNPMTVSDGTPPTAPPIPSKEQRMTAPVTGPAPGAAGTTPATETQARPADATEATARVAILEAELTQLRSRAATQSEQLAEAQADARRANARADQAESDLRRLRGNEAGRTTVDRLLAAPESGVPDNLQAHIGPRVHAAITNHVPLTDAGEVDQTALDAAVAAAIRTERVHAAALLEAQGVGRVSGLGADGDPHTQMSEEDLEKGLTDVFGRIGLTESVAKLAAKGR